MDSFEPQRKHRWVLENPGLESFRVWSIDCASDPHPGALSTDLQMAVRLHALDSTDLSRFPFEGTAAILKVLDEDGNVNESYRITWKYSQFIPFLSLSYDGGEGVVQLAILQRVSFERIVS